MSISSTIGNISYNVQDNISSLLSFGRTSIENIVGTTTTSLSNLWDGGFTGMSEAEMENLKQALTKYCADIQDVISGFDQTGDITQALKGDVQTAAYDFIAAIKVLLQAYVSTMKQEIAEADEAYRNFVASGKSISQDVQAAAADIRQNAKSISLDAKE